jgi:hypothetical protein
MNDARLPKNEFAALAARPGYEEVPGHPLVAALRELRERHDLMGCVLISFDGANGRVAVNSSGFDDQTGAAMDRLAAAILGAIDDGEFDPMETTR